MSTTILVRFAGRNLRFVLKNCEDHFSQLKFQFEEKVKVDSYLSSQRAKYANISFQIPDPLFPDIELRDLESDDQLVNGQEVFLHLVENLGAAATFNSLESSGCVIMNSMSSKQLSAEPAFFESFIACMDSPPSCEETCSPNRAEPEPEASLLHSSDDITASNRENLEEICTSPESDEFSDSELQGPIPVPFPFPCDRELGPELLSQLKGRSIHPLQRNRIIRLIADTLLRYQWYPTKRDYSRITAETLRKWPSLGTTHGSAWAAFQLALSKRVRYLRQFRKQRSKLPKPRREKQATARRLPWVFGPKQTSTPDPLHSADEIVTHDGLVNVMKENLDSLTSISLGMMMAQTYGVRRHEILKEQSAVQDILEKYPALSIFQQAKEEFTRVTSREDICFSVREKWAHFLPKLVALAEKETTNITRQELRSLNSAEPNFERTSKTVLRVLPYLFPFRGPASKRWTVPKNNFIYAEFEGRNLDAAAASIPGRNSPFIMLIADRFVITLEQKPYMKVDGDVIDALVALMATYYNLNLSFPPEAAGALVILQTVVFGIPNEEFCSDKVTYYLTELQRD